MPMLSRLLFTIYILASLSMNAQTFTTLSTNNSSVFVTDNGYFFHDATNGAAGYEFPSGSGKTMIYSSSFWIGGKDINDQLKIAAQRYYGSGDDFWPGACELMTADYVNPNPLGQTLWKVSKAEIYDHIVSYNQPGYIMPQDIMNWPAHGDTNVGSLGNGQAYYLAPFVDYNNNGYYDPENGDYPCIHGDEEIYTIQNDKGDVHGSGGSAIGVEIHYAMYQFTSIPEFEDVTFIEAKVYNRSTQTLFDTRFSNFVDFDLGNYLDDFIGCDSARNMMFIYNGDSDDEDNSGTIGYGATPPAMGVISLDQPMAFAGYTVNAAGPQFSDPSVAIEYYNYMNGSWVDGSPWLDNNFSPTNFMYPSDPNDTTGWSLVTEGALPNDFRGILTVDLGTFVPFMDTTLNFAYVPAQGTDNLNSVTALYNKVDNLQAYWNANPDLHQSCFTSGVGINELPFDLVDIYPNPSQGLIHVILNESSSDASLTVVDLAGNVVYEKNDLSSSKIDLELAVPDGVYFLTVTTTNGNITKKIIIRQ